MASDNKRERRLSAEEVTALGRAMREGDESPVTIAAVKLMLLTGFRRMEALRFGASGSTRRRAAFASRRPRRARRSA